MFILTAREGYKLFLSRLARFMVGKMIDKVIKEKFGGQILAQPGEEAEKEKPMASLQTNEEAAPSA